MSHSNGQTPVSDCQTSLKRAAAALCDNGGPGSAKRTRGRTGCLNCRRRRKKCDEIKPKCSKCQSRGENCEWDTGVTFRFSGIDAQHPSMLQAKSTRKRNSQAEFRIVDVTFDGNRIPKADQAGIDNDDEEDDDYGGVEADQTRADLDKHQDIDERHCWSNGISLEHINLQTSSSIVETLNAHQTIVPTQNGTLFPIPEDSTVSCTSTAVCFGTSMPKCRPFPYEQANPIDCNGHETDTGGNNGNLIDTDIQMLDLSQSNSGSCTSLQSTNGSKALSESSASTVSSRSARQDCAKVPHHYDDDPRIELEVLDYLTSHPSSMSVISASIPQNGTSVWDTIGTRLQDSPPHANGLANPESPDNYAVYYPNATYKQLHTTLRQHMVDAARVTAKAQRIPSRLQTDESTAAFGDLTLNGVATSRGIQLSSCPKAARPLGCTKLAKRRQLELWRNYLEEIAIWLDMFDNERHFQCDIPVMAKSADHLHYSILALSARQLERKDPEKPYTESLGLYQDAIQLIVRDLHTLSTAVIASCVLLCVLEMMSSSPRAWGRHLDGCAMLLEAAGINGVVGGVKQALFWCFARMDVWGGFLGDTLTKIPTSRWFLSGSMSTAVSRFKSRAGGDSYANYAVFLCASVVNVISNQYPASTIKDKASDQDVSYAARWKALFELLEDWYNSRPEEMQPLMSYPSILDDQRHPFPLILYGSSPAVNGNQLYHASAILMLQEKPKEAQIPKSHKSILWHARQICGIAGENHHHGPWINALQPLWIAGKVMSHVTEHQAILDILTRIERETGWATAWRAQDLKDYWGEDEK